MAATRLLRMSRPLAFTENGLLSNHNVSSRPRTVKCLSKVGLSSDLSPAAAGERKPAAGCCSACTVVSEPKTHDGIDSGFLFAYVAEFLSNSRKFVVEQRSLGLHVQIFVEKVTTIDILLEFDLKHYCVSLKAELSGSLR